MLNRPPLTFTSNSGEAIRRRTLRWCVALALLVAFGLVGSPRNASAAEVEVTQASPLTWGFKGSWRTYAGQPTVADGAAIVPELLSYNLSWQFDSGSYDDQTRTTVLRYRGSVRFKSHNAITMGYQQGPPGYEGPLDVDVLDLTLSDPQVTISRDVANITARVTSRNPTTWQIIDYGRIPVVDLGLDGVTPAVAGPTTSWSAIPATITEEAPAPFGDVYYTKGTRVDPVSLSYTGPGGAPDLNDHFDVPGRVVLGLDGDNVEVLDNTAQVGAFNTLAIDPARKLLYFRVESVDNGVQSYTYRVFDLDAMREIVLSGPPLTLPVTTGGQARVVDASSGKVYVAVSNSPIVQHWIRYDADTNTLVQGDDAGSIPTTSNAGNTVSWDPIGGRAYEIVRHIADGVGATDYNNHQWQLKTYTRQDDGTWATQGYDLPNGPSGLNATVYLRNGAVAGDGSFIVLGTRQVSQPAGAVTPPTTINGAYRVVTHEDGTATTTPIPGTEIPNASASVFAAALPGRDGHVSLINRSGTGKAQGVDVTPPAGQEITAGPVVDLGFPPSNLAAEAFTVDPDDGTLWVAGVASRRVVGVRDGRLIADQVLPLRNPRGGPLVALPGGRLVMQSGDGVDAGGLTNQAYGFQQLAKLGTTPTVTGDPQAQSATLTADSEQEAVSFTAAATANPAPAVRWQAKAPGATRFVDIAGADDETLSVDAKRGMDGTQYRAVFANAAGVVATEVATLEVRYAPRVTLDLRDQVTRPGQGATFDVLVDGNPEPQVTWQRRVSGFWQAIDPEDDNFMVQDGKLVVPDTNLEQSGTFLRARLRSDIATAYTRAAKLTVELPAARDLVGVHLDWTGSPELQRKAPSGAANFFSAGESDGSQATYAVATAGVRVLHVTAGGEEYPASWITREQHLTAGSKQLVRLVDGTGSIEADGTATVSWTGSFTVNMYGGLVPFTITDPVLHVDPDGRGTLKATLSGYASSLANPSQRTPLARVSGVTIATFANATIDPAGASTITPDYRGVEVSVPGGQTQQDRTGDQWGAWPQPFVDFQVQTGLGSYWYSSGGAADPHKAPNPLVVNVTSKVTDKPAALPDPISVPDLGAQPAPPVAPAPIAAQPKPKAKAPTITVYRTAQPVSSERLARLATLACPAGTGACRVTAPKRTVVRIAGQRYSVTVLAPKSIQAARKATIRVRLPKAAADRLRGRRATVSVKVSITVGGKKTTRTITAIVSGKQAAKRARRATA